MRYYVLLLFLMRPQNVLGLPFLILRAHDTLNTLTHTRTHSQRVCPLWSAVGLVWWICVGSVTALLLARSQSPLARKRSQLAYDDKLLRAILVFADARNKQGYLFIMRNNWGLVSVWLMGISECILEDEYGLVLRIDARCTQTLLINVLWPI